MVESIYLINNKNKVGANVSCLSAPYLDTAQGQDRQSKFRAQILQTSWKKEFTEEKRAGVCTVIRQSNLMNPRLCPYHFHLHPKSITASFFFCFHLVVAFDTIAELITGRRNSLL